jgi:Ca-activated chloride channel homolog
MQSVWFTKYRPKPEPPFTQLKNVLLELALIVSGDWEALKDWLGQIVSQYPQLLPEGKTLDDFWEAMQKEGILKFSPDPQSPAPEWGKHVGKLWRDLSLDSLFGKLEAGKGGSHKSMKTGGAAGDEFENRPWSPGDNFASVNIAASYTNAWKRTGNFKDLEPEDLVVRDSARNTSVSTVLLIDISHSMILYGEDRITPAKKVALALAEYLKRKFPKDTLDFATFGNEAKPIALADIPFLSVGPYHTNTVAGLELAMNMLHRRRANNKRIFMITDGKPTCLKTPEGYYKNSVGLDPKIIAKTLGLAEQCRRQKIRITTFMIATDPYLQAFVEEFTRVNGGEAFYSGLDNLGKFVLKKFGENRSI